MYQKELLKGNTETLLLSLLNRRPMYGYQIVKDIDAKSSGYFQFKEGTLYPALHRLEKGGYIQGRWQELDTGVPRRYYHITAKGKRALAQRLAEWDRFTKAVSLVMVQEIGPG